MKLPKRYLHVMNNDKFIEPFINFINNNFEEEEHFFIIIDGIDFKEKELKNYKNILRIKKEKKEISLFVKIIRMLRIWVILLKNMKNKDKIYFHGLFDKRNIIFLYVFRKYLKISNWIAWGGDIYSYEKRKNKIVNRLWYKIEDYVKSNIAYVNTLVAGDYDIAKKYYNVKGKYKEAYYSNPNKDFYKKMELLVENSINKDKNDISIQIGNSGDPSNNHKDILDTLLKFRNQNIKIYCQLSYGGTEEYKNDLINYGQELYGLKFIPILDFVPKEEYYKQLANMDILVVNHNRQQGLGNITIFSFFEKKVYLRNNITSWNHYTNNLKCIVNSYEDIKNQSFKEFIKNNAKGNKEKILKTIYSKEYVVNVWKKNFED